jgi:hypothetical protein
LIRLAKETRKNGGKSAKPMPPVEHQFKPGNPGRPKGSRNKLGEAFIQALHDDFTEHGANTIVKVRKEKPHEYLKVVAGLLPKELKIERSDELSDSELEQRIRQLASIIGVEVGTSGASGREEAPEGPQPSGVVSTLQ